MMGDFTPALLEGLDMVDATFCSPDLTVFCRLDDLGLVVVAQRVTAKGTVLVCRVVPSEEDRFCRRCRAKGVVRDTVTRRLAHVSFGWRAMILLVRIRRSRCAGCHHVWRQDTTVAAEPKAKLARAAVTWALVALAVGHLTVARVAEALGVSWHTANDAVLAEGKRVLIDDAHRFDGVQVLGVDEHVWRHTRRGDKYVTVIIDLTPIRDGTGHSWLLDMAPGRFKKVFKAWLVDRPDQGRDGAEGVAMGRFTGFKTAITEELPDTVAVMDPFHVVRLAGDGLDRCRQRVQQTTCGHCGRKGDPLYAARRTLYTGADLLTDKQKARIEALFAVDAHVEVEATWGIYQSMIAAYRHLDPATGRALMTRLIESISHTVPVTLTERSSPSAGY